MTAVPTRKDRGPKGTDPDPTKSRRIGPRPLALHLATAGATLTGAMAALPLAQSGGIPWHPDIADRAGGLLAEMKAADGTRLGAAIAAECARRMQATLAGIEKYQTHPWHRIADDPPAVWRQGAVRLLDYGLPDRPDAPVVMFVPSQINRAWVLDLLPDNSMLRWLAAEAGLRPLLLDWGTPGRPERRYDVAAFLGGPLSSALDAAVSLNGDRPVPVVGYCMGGTLSVALGLLRSDAVSALALLASPWDFHADLSPQAEAFAASLPMWQPVLEAFGEMPIDLIQAFFAALDPNLAQRKFARFASMDPDSEKARQFVALEDWLNDGPALPPRVAHDCLVGWYNENLPGTGRWQIGATAIRPGDLRMPVFAAIPAQDRIVPPASARGAVVDLPDATVIEPAAGHIGMVVGSRARRSLWQPLAAWLGAVT